jgi:hypothetical protein
MKKKKYYMEAKPKDFNPIQIICLKKNYLFLIIILKKMIDLEGKETQKNLHYK